MTRARKDKVIKAQCVVLEGTQMKVYSDYHQTSDGSIVTASGDVLYFSIERFKRDICEGNCCFICGVSPNEADFNNEHVIPEWVLRELSLFANMITLPNGEAFRYDRYKVPCCCKCNSLLGARFEKPVSSILKGGLHSVSEHLKKAGPWLLFKWMALLYFKTHLKDKAFRWHLNKSRASFAISEAYYWEELHHIHCIARSFYVEPEFEQSALGTLIVVPASLAIPWEQFDYCDLYAARTVCVRFRDVAIFCVLNDSCACLSIEKDRLLTKIEGPLSPLQIREVLARLGYLNLLIKERPQFHSTFLHGLYTVAGTHPKSVETEKWDAKQYGAIMLRACENELAMCQNKNTEITREHIQMGRYTFLFDQDGRFNHDSMKFTTEPE